MSYHDCKSPATLTRIKIKGLLRNIVVSFCYLSGMSHLWYWIFAKRSIRILAYHGVEVVPGNSFSVSVTDFENQMKFIKERFNVVNLKDIKTNCHKKKLFNNDMVVITFDDGLQNFYDHAYPILKKYNLEATCFIITSKSDSFDVNFMHWDELQNLVCDELISIGSHTFSHTSLKDMDDKHLYYELIQSKKALEKMLAIPIELFCYPYGTVRDYDQFTTQAIKKCGYKIACTSTNGVNSKSTDVLKLRRTKIEAGDGITTFRRIMFGALDIWVLADYFLYFLQKNNEVNFRD